MPAPTGTAVSAPRCAESEGGADPGLRRGDPQLWLAHLWGENGAPVKAARAFADWRSACLARTARPALLDYRRLSAEGAAAHPSEEHLLPLYRRPGRRQPGEDPLRLEPEYTYGGLAMDAYLWQDASPAPYHPEH